MDDPKQPIAWDATWQSASKHFCNLNSDSMRAMSCLVTELALMTEIRGLFAMPSITTLRISPYSCYPDWFDGRFVIVDANGPNGVTIHVAANAHDHSPQKIECAFADAPTTIAAFCREHL